MLNEISEFSDFYVVKRDGTKEKFNPKKIMVMVEWACDNKNVLPYKLYESFMKFIVDGMSTSIIQDQLVKVALSLTSLEEPAWSQVAGSLRLLVLYKNHKEYMKDPGIFGYSTLYDWIIAANNDKLIDPEIVEKYSKQEIEIINRDIDIEYDSFDYSGINLLDKRYLIQYEGKTVEPPQFMYIITSMVVNKNIENKEERLQEISKYYATLAMQTVSPATPNLSNLRKYGRGSSPSCFILDQEDSLESIYDTVKRSAIISKNGGASGVNFSNIRAAGSFIKGIKGAAKGVLPWMKLYNDTAVAVDQLSTRTGAITVSLDVWHRDIFDFMDMRKENIDSRMQCQDLFGQVAVNDVFLSTYLKAVANDSREPDWLIFCPHEFYLITGKEIAKTYGQEFHDLYNIAYELYLNKNMEICELVSSRDLFKRILENAKESGLPYAFNKDYVNLCNPNKHEGIIANGNLCMESFSTFNFEYSHSCNLHSINLANCKSDSEIEEAVRISVRALNRIVTLSTSPLESTRAHNDRYRIIGLGALGYHDHLVMNGRNYTGSVDYAYQLFEKIAYWAIDESVEEAKRTSEYPAFSGSDWEKGIFFGRNVYDPNFSKTPGMNKKWIDLYENRVSKHGMANGGLIAIAPTTSTSQLVNSSASILPVYKKFFIEKNKLMVVPFAAKYLSLKTMWLYQEAITMNPESVIDVCQAASQWVDQGISMELVLNNNLYNDAKTLRDWYIKALVGDGNMLRSKTIYYLRPIQQSKEECSSCAN